MAAVDGPSSAPHARRRCWPLAESEVGACLLAPHGEEDPWEAPPPDWRTVARGAGRDTLTGLG